MGELPNMEQRDSINRQKVVDSHSNGRISQRAVLAAALGAGLSTPLAASAQGVATENSHRVVWNISAGLTGAETNITNVSTGVVTAARTEVAPPTCTANPSGHGLGTCQTTTFPAFPQQTPPGSLWHIGVPGMISGSFDVLWKERFSIGAGLSANLLRLPIPGIDYSLNVVGAGIRAAYRTPDSIWDIHLGVGGDVQWSESNSTLRWRINAGFGSTIYTSRSRTNPRGFFSFDLGTSIDPSNGEMWSGLGISGGVQLQ